MDRERSLREMYAAFNARDIDGPLADDQTGRDAAGDVLFDQQVLHVYAYRGDLVERMTIEAAD